MADKFYSTNIIGKMQEVPKALAFRGSPKTESTNKSSTFSRVQKMGSQRIKTSGGIPGSKSKDDFSAQRSGSVSFRGDSLKKGSGHSYISSGPVKNGD